MTRRWTIGLASTLSLTALGVAQQTGAVRGVVRDKEFGGPVAAVRVLAVEADRSVLTDDRGSYVLGQLAAGRHTFVFTKEGHARFVRTDVVVTAGQLTEIDASLSGEFTDMDEFVVQDALKLSRGTEAALLQLRLDSPALMDSISADVMSKAGASDAAGALRLVAGASVQDGKSAVIRGMPDRYVSSQLNGVRLPSADEDKRAVELDQFPAAAIDSIQVSKTFTPDQQGDASGGAVNIRLRGVPAEPWLLRFKIEGSNNSQVTGRSDFLTYRGGGVHAWAKDGGDRAPQDDRLGRSWRGAAGVSRSEAPVDYKYSGAMGGRHQLWDGVDVGGLLSVFYERDSAGFDGGKDDSYWVESPGDPMTPKTSQGTVKEGDFKTSLFDVTQGKQSVQWGLLGTVGLESKHHKVSLSYLYTRTAEDTATLAEDTRGKHYFFPGHEPDDGTTPGHEDPDAAPYLRLETLEYTERSVGSLQLSGQHEFPFARRGFFLGPKIDWVASRSTAEMAQPDKRQFGSLWLPGRIVGPLYLPPTHRQFKPAANFTLGNLQRIWKSIDEESEQYATNLELPFEQWTKTQGSLKFGWFRDDVKRTFDQDTYSNFDDNSSYAGEFGEFWSARFPGEDHPISESLFDVDYQGRQTINAWYAMLDLPLTRTVRAIGGVRFEDTRIGVVNDPEESATWFPPGSVAPTRLNPGDADVNFQQDDALPAVALVYTPFDWVTLRASYSETIARQTFKELTPILQQEFLGGPVFIGNPGLKMSSLRNHDLRLDLTPLEGSLLSVSWFDKDIDGAIEYVQKIASFDYTTAVNYPKGQLSGYELEARQKLGALWEGLDGFALGANGTFIDASVTLPADEAAGFADPSINAPMTKRDMTNAPTHLYNFFTTYELKTIGTQLALFYTVQGDTLVAGAGQANGNFVPSLYAKEFDTLNLSVSQALGPHMRLQFAAKNLTDPTIRAVYRSEYIGDDVTKTSFTRGVDYSLSLTGEIRF